MTTTSAGIAYLHHVLPLQHAVGVGLKPPSIHGVADQEAEVGLNAWGGK